MGYEFTGGELLKFEPGGDLDAMQPQLIQEAINALVSHLMVALSIWAVFERFSSELLPRRSRCGQRKLKGRAVFGVVCRP